METLQTLGKRISIIGPSNSGKSTLAQRLAEKLEIPAWHLDQVAHVPGTNWQPRAIDEWKGEHDDLIASDSWVIDGNYSFAMPQRFKRSTSVIWLDFNTAGCVKRYLLRSIRKDPARPGRLKNATNDFSFALIHYILFRYPQKRKKAKAILDQQHVRVLRIGSMRELNNYYRFWDL